MLRQLAEAASAGAVAAQLEREEDWRPFLREAAEVVSDPGEAVRTAIGQHRAARLAALGGMYQPPARDLVEALVLPLDRECAMAVLRRMRAGETPQAILAAVTPGAVLRSTRLDALCHASDPASAVRALARAHVVSRADAEAVSRLMDDAAWETIEKRLFDAFERSRDVRAREQGDDGALVRAMLAAERDDSRRVLAELIERDASHAVDLERLARLARFDRLARRARRNPLGVGVVAGYAAAIEAQAIRLRAILAHVAAGWSRELFDGYLAGVAA